jgi:hypothetical protein
VTSHIQHTVEAMVSSCCSFRGREKADGDPLLLAGIKDGAMVQVVETLAYQVPCLLSPIFHQRPGL